MLARGCGAEHYVTNGHVNQTSLFSAYSEGKAGRSAAVDLKEKVKQIVVI
jgi:hypothetical protein